MTVLHDHFHKRNKQAFQRLLDGSAERTTGAGRSGPSTSGGKSKSWTRQSLLISWNVNARDSLGRAVLHLACSATDGFEYVRLLLRHPSIDVNLPDIESHWTPLHRALYSGNIPTVLLLLKRDDTDRFAQDLEGYTPFDLYNSTFEETKPVSDATYAELYTWGTNRNATLGQGDAGDRGYPDLVVIKGEIENQNIAHRPSSILVRQVQMSKLHTAVVTSESEGNLRLCGFGSGGRLGPAQHTQYHLKPLPEFSNTVVSVALGQDHTLALTKAGEVLSWGLNRFSQLGYVLDSPAPKEGFGKMTEEPIQVTPRKVAALKRLVVRGVAASKSASACWTDEHVYTWGTNSGQLGYPMASDPQVLPRITTWVTQPVLGISLTEAAMACLLASRDVVCIFNDRHLKVNFPAHGFPTEIQPRRPRQGFQGDKIVKVTSSDDTFAALSSKGELFTFSVLASTEGAPAQSKDKSISKPQPVWALRKSSKAVKDVALGSDGSIIVCTVSGQVLVRTRISKGSQSVSGKMFKFQRVPQLQRVTQVCANSTGAFAALRVEFKPKPIQVSGNSLGGDLALLRPFLLRGVSEARNRDGLLAEIQQPEDGHDDIEIENDIIDLFHLLDALEKSPRNLSATPPLAFSTNHGADVVVHVSERIFMCHRIILCARSRMLLSVLNGSMVIKSKEHGIFVKLKDLAHSDGRHQVTHLAFNGCQPLAALIFLTFLYSDELLAVWDRRISVVVEDRLNKLKIDPVEVRNDLRALAEILGIQTLSDALKSPSKHKPNSSLGAAMKELFELTQLVGDPPAFPLIPVPDVILRLSDKDIFCYSAILRARSPFFADFFDEDDWTANRWQAGCITVNMKHLEWRVMKYVLSFVCWGEEDLFDTLDFATSVDEVLNLVFDVMAVATELLLDRLVLLCSTAILRYLTLQNACYILVEASHLFAEQLIERVQSFVAVNMDLFLEADMLYELPSTHIKQLAQYIRTRQEENSSVARSGFLIKRAMEMYADWLASQPDFSSGTSTPEEELTTLVSVSPKAKGNWVSTNPVGSLEQSPILRAHRPIRRPPSNDDIFTMDDADVPISDAAQLALATPSTGNPPAAWKVTVAPRVDMKAVMAETASRALTHQHQSNISPAPVPWTPARSPRISRTVSNPIDKPEHGSSLQSTHSLTPSTPPSSRALPAATPSPARKQLVAIPPVSKTSTSPSGLGPIFTPTKQALFPSKAGPSSGTIHRASGKAWGQPNMAALSQPIPTPGMSLVAIQQLELDQLANSASSKAKRSLLEIQEEEKGRQQEENFLAWWAAEEERIKQEDEMMAMLTAKSLESSIATSSKSAKTKRKPQPARKVDHPEGGQNVVEGSGGSKGDKKNPRKRQ